MVGPVEWGSYPGELLEQVMAVLLFQERPKAWRRTPSRGDGGVDVVDLIDGGSGYHVFQVKRFAGRIGASERRQIAESLKTARTDPRLDKPIVHWSVLFPSDLTSGEEEWFRELVADAPFPCEWLGKVFWDSEASKYPYVIDYYLQDGKERVVQRMRVLAEILRHPEQPVQPADVRPSLMALGQELNSADPHFRYEIKITAEPGEPPAHPDLVLSVSEYSESGRCVSVDVFARYPQALDDAPPIGGTLNIVVRDTERGIDIADELTGFFDFGRPVSLSEGSVAGVRLVAPGGLGGEHAGGTAQLGAAQVTSFTPHTQRLRVCDPDGESLVELFVHMTHATAGRLGVEVHGCDLDEALDITMTLERPHDEDEGSLTVAFSFRDWTARPAVRLLRSTHFLSAMRSPNTLELLPEFGPDAMGVLALPDEGMADIPAVVAEIIEMLASLQEHTAIPLHVPDPITQGTYKALKTACSLMAGGTLTAQWDHGQIVLPAANAETAIAALRDGHDISVDVPLTIHVGDVEVTVGTVRQTLSGVTLIEWIAEETSVRLDVEGGQGAIITAQLASNP